MATTNILILGGYGNFGKRIVENLSTLQNVQLIVAGRNPEKASELLSTLKNKSCALLNTAKIDINSSDFESQLLSLTPHIVIHTSGPFQNQNHRVPIACIDIGAHYIDLADDRRFVCDIKELDKQAKNKNVLVVSGASSVPGLSSSVIDNYRTEFKEIDTIDIAIAPGNQAERGEATVRGILSYTGHPFKVFSSGKWLDIYGWMNPRKIDFGGIIGKRWLANVDVPDLELFLERYSVKSKVMFQAGLELSILHWAMVFMAFIAKIKVFKSWSKLTKLIVHMSNWFMKLGSDIGGMEISISGQDNSNAPKKVIWNLYAADGVGPYIPTLSAIIIARKLVHDEIGVRGAMSCIGLFTVEEFYPHADKFGIYYKEEIIG